MTFSNQFIKVTWLFSVKDSDEIADTSINYTSSPSWTGAVTALEEIESSGNLVDFYPAYHSTLMNPLHISWADYSVLQGVKVAAIGTDGHYLTDPLVYEAGSPVDGTAVGVLPQNTVVLSLRSGYTLGSGNYGRLYLPHTTLGTEAEHPRASAALAASFAEDAKAFVNEVTDIFNDNVTVPMVPAIMSQTTTPSARYVAEVAIGRVTDTQRRRRNKLAEDYQVESLA